MLFTSLLLIGFLGSIALHSASALQNTMTFTTGDTINFSSTNETTFWSNVTMKFGTGITIQFVEMAPNGYLEPCDYLKITWPVGFQLSPCSWWEVLDPLGNPTGIEFHVDFVEYDTFTYFHVDIVLPMSMPLPPQPVTAELKIQEVSPCDYFVVHWPKAWYPPVCSWWEIIDPETGLPTGFEFHVDYNNESCEFHVDEVVPHYYTPPYPVYEIEARQKITQIKPCDWFVVLDPAGLVPSPCSWWYTWANGMPYGGRFHVDSVDIVHRAFHVDQATPNPIDLSYYPEYPTVARQSMTSLASCQWLKVDDLAKTPKPCTWWHYNVGPIPAEFHVDQSYANNGTFHVDNVLPSDPMPFLPLGIGVGMVTAEKKFVGLGPCDWFQVADPQQWLPEPCSWWKITWPTQWAGVTFHVDTTDGISKFHIDAADPLPPGPTPPPWNVTAVRAQPPSGPWYVKPAYPDYAPSGMPDFDQKQDMWGPAQGTFTWCGPVAVANSLWWLDSQFESILNPNPVPPPQVSDYFPLVTAMVGQWDDHDAQNVDPLVRNLAFWMDTDGQRTQDGHKGTRMQDMQWGINQYLMQQQVARWFEVHNSTYPQFPWIESEIERCQDVVLFLEFWQWTGSSWQKLYDNPSLEQGHCVTSAGVNSTTSELLISDPYQDAFEAGTAPGRSPVPHPAGHPSQVHNDAQYVSQDAYSVAPWILPPPPPAPMPPTVCELVGYLQTLGYNPSWHAFITGAVVTSPLALPDVAVTNVTSPKSVIGRGYSGNITVTAENQGTLTESFNVTLYANTTKISTEILFMNLVGGANASQVFEWNTTGLAYGNYTLKAVADTLPGEIDTADNNYTCNHPVHVGVPGDVSGTIPGVYDGVDNMKDIAYLVSLFQTKPTKPPWFPNADVNNDGVVDMKDIAIAVYYFNQRE